MTHNDEIRDIFAEIEKEHSDKEITFPCKQCLLNGIKKGFEAGQKSSTQKILGEINPTIDEVLSYIREGCGADFILEEQDVECGEDFEYEDKVKVILCPSCLNIGKKLEILKSHLADVHSPKKTGEINDTR